MSAEESIRYEKLRVTVDKSHIVAIGERLYAESIELLRELVNNAYDADATSVKVTVSDSRIQVDDDGSGMDLGGLRQYFNIGSDAKVVENRSPRFGRLRIGQFGIGKFASLAAARTFEVFTQRGAFAASVVFDKQDWQTDRDAWELPLTILPADPARGDGTSVALTNLVRTFDPAEIERILKDGVPLKEHGFKVLLNGRRVLPRIYSGRKVPVMEGCAFGPVTGEIFILSESASTDLVPGIEIKVRQVTVRRETFGMDEWGGAGARVTGEMYADFLPVTSDRTGFQTDSPEYRAFVEVAQRILGDVRKSIGRMGEKREHIRSSRALTEAVSRLQLALSKNPQFSPFGVVEPPSRERREKPPGAAAGPATARIEPGSDKAATRKRRTRYPKVKNLTPRAVVKKSRLGESLVSFCLDHFGETAQEAFTDGGVIYINVDHPLFMRESARPATFVMHVARLLTQEVALMKCPRNPRQAFERQSVLLRDAFVEPPA